MNEAQRKNSEELRRMASSEAADWLISSFPKDGCIYIAKRIWDKSDQLKLAEHFLKNIPHASKSCYGSLLTIMALPKFVGIIRRYIPAEESGKILLKYHLYPLLEKFAKTEKDRNVILELKEVLS